MSILNAMAKKDQCVLVFNGPLFLNEIVKVLNAYRIQD